MWHKNTLARTQKIYAIFEIKNIAARKQEQIDQTSIPDSHPNQTVHTCLTLFDKLAMIREWLMHVIEILIVKCRLSFTPWCSGFWCQGTPTVEFAKEHADTPATS